ncbi:hypothetical protein NM688_g6856 [Phlebia brevispora]|uniref:Uncharacterized protein n=1 Tax=Phlebia brevispora TaxID=194682 RepID=A0ACC1SBU1_9APHY|nr:hypothetical protein NM688_g6856 [Phlebia brevispora]
MSNVQRPTSNVDVKPVKHASRPFHVEADALAPMGRGKHTALLNAYCRPDLKFLIIRRDLALPIPNYASATLRSKDQHNFRLTAALTGIGWYPLNVNLTACLHERLPLLLSCWDRADIFCASSARERMERTVILQCPSQETWKIIDVRSTGGISVGLMFRAASCSLPPIVAKSIVAIVHLLTAMSGHSHHALRLKTLFFVHSADYDVAETADLKKAYAHLSCMLYQTGFAVTRED